MKNFEKTFGYTLMKITNLFYVICLGIKFIVYYISLYQRSFCPPSAPTGLIVNGLVALFLILCAVRWNYKVSKLIFSVFSLMAATQVFIFIKLFTPHTTKAMVSAHGIALSIALSCLLIIRFQRDNK